MVKIFTESGIEKSIIEWLDGDLDWNYFPANELDDTYEREQNEAVYWKLLREKLIEINDEIDESNVDDLISSLKRDMSYENLLEGNKEFLEILRRGKPFTIKDGKEKKRKYIKIIDFENPDRNSFIVTNQFRFRQKESKIPDVVLLLNGIPLVIMELKAETQESDYQDAIDDIHEVEEVAPRLFIPNLLNVAADEDEYRYGAIGAPSRFYYPWGEAPEKYDFKDNKVKRAVYAMFNHETLMDILKYFVFYGHKEGQTIKIIPRYMQYYAANRIIDRIKRGKYKSGLIWHTQGSGKSYTMFFAAYKIQKTRPIENPKVLIIVDRDKLNGQMRDDLYDVNFPNFKEARTINHLEKLLNEDASRTILTTIQKFQDVDLKREEDNFVIFSDEAHRFLERKLGSKLEATLPNAYHFGFTGTPVRDRERDTFDLFMPDGKDELYLHYYSIAKGIEDQLILPVCFEIKDTIWDLKEEELKNLDLEFDQEFKDLPIEEKAKVIRKYVNKSDLAEIRPRVKKIVKKINEHYDTKFNGTGYKAMIVTPSRRAAAIYKEEMDKQRDPNESAAIYSGTGTGNDVVGQYIKSPEEIDKIIDDFEDPEKDPKILIVCNMLLTGFDAPILKVMYLDRPLHDHSLLQAIARTNRPRDGKYNGLIVDFQRVFENIDEALDYPKDIQRKAAVNSDELKKEFEKVLEELMDIFKSVKIENTQESINSCVNLLSKNPERRKEFKELYRKLQDLYETISPDKFLAKGDIDTKYTLISQIHLVFKRRQSREDSPERNLRKKTKELIEKHIDVKKIKEDYPIYEISYDHLEKIRDLEPAAKATEIAFAMQKHIKGRIGNNPRYIA
ncbi:MAG: type I restriction endonuclease subunit R, partial [Elusimicrobiota bacterium]